MEQAPQTNSWKYYPAGKYFSSKYLTQNTVCTYWEKNAVLQLLFSSRRTLKPYIEYNNVAVTHSTVIFIEI